MSNNIYVSISELATYFGLGRGTMGKLLKRLGLRTAEGRPSGAAFEGEFVQAAPSGWNDGYFYKWHMEKTLAALAAAGHHPLLQQVATVQPGQLTGPFEHRFSGSAYEIVNNEGIAVACASTERTAIHIVALLNGNLSN